MPTMNTQQFPLQSRSIRRLMSRFRRRAIRAKTAVLRIHSKFPSRPRAVELASGDDGEKRRTCAVLRSFKSVLT
ncbi:hypothetical protein BHM03_00016254 [Ensete ventricosum]|uniref:Uncharacterized protein n=1 Tax=Ensete ventricosum TaxID=4639 RepID=A0A426X5T8_ENSVE|nr:hypothetical protein B296_00038631 [Ensete ventricosum]RZR88623.1 hypothetical protein BHM03_00016254 [Ensete ventricosum]